MLLLLTLRSDGMFFKVYGFKCNVGFRFCLGFVLLIYFDCFIYLNGVIYVNIFYDVEFCEKIRCYIIFLFLVIKVIFL